MDSSSSGRSTASPALPVLEVASLEVQLQLRASEEKGVQTMCIEVVDAWNGCYLLLRSGLMKVEYCAALLIQALDLHCGQHTIHKSDL